MISLCWFLLLGQPNARLAVHSHKLKACARVVSQSTSGFVFVKSKPVKLKSTMSSVASPLCVSVQVTQDVKDLSTLSSERQNGRRALFSKTPHIPVLPESTMLALAPHHQPVLAPAPECLLVSPPALPASHKSPALLAQVQLTAPQLLCQVRFVFVFLIVLF